MTKQEILTYLFEHKDEFYEKYSITELGLFGSYARGNATQDSDIDLVIEMEKDTVNVHEKKEAFKALLENTFGKKIDIAREKYLKPIARKEILEDLCRV